MHRRNHRVERWGLVLVLAPVLVFGASAGDCRRVEAQREAGPAGPAPVVADDGGDVAEPLRPPPSCRGTLPRLDVLPPGYGWHCYEDVDEPRFSFCMRAVGDCERSRGTTIETLAQRGEVHRLSPCEPQNGAYCHTFVNLERSLPLYFCFPTRDGCAASTRVLGAQPELYGEVSCCEAFVTS